MPLPPPPYPAPSSRPPDADETNQARTLAERERIPFADLYEIEPDRQARDLLSRAAAKRLGAVPIALLPTGKVRVALYDSWAIDNLTEVSHLLAREVEAVMAPRSQVLELMEVSSIRPTRFPRLSESPPPPSPPVPPPAPPIVADVVPEPPAVDVDARLQAAEARADGMAAAAQAANEAVARLVDELRRERDHRERLEAELAELRAPAPEPVAVPAPAPAPVVSAGPPVAAPTPKARGLLRMIAALRRP